MVGEKLADRYRLTERMAAGRFLSTYLATDLVLGTEVEVDVVEVQGTEGSIPDGRLKEILDAALSLRGRSISPLFAWGEGPGGGFFYMVREKSGGVSLAEVLEDTGEMPLWQVVEITRAAVDVLAEAYGRGLFYLGLNPHQILLLGGGGIRFTRAGFAWVLEDAEPGLASRVSAYRSPETDGGKEGSRTSDVYALAALLRRMLPRGEGSERLHALLEMSMDPMPKRRPSSPRLLLEELEGGLRGRIAERKSDEGGREEKRWRDGGMRNPVPDEEEPERISLARKPRRRILRVTLLVLASGLALWVLYAAVAGILAGGEESGEIPAPAAAEEKAALPDLQGLTAAEAEKILTELGLECASREAPSRLWSAGRIIAQEPAEGSLLQPGETVCLVVSTGREEEVEGAADEEGIPTHDPSAGGEVPSSVSAGEGSLSLHVPPQPVPSPAVNAPPHAVPVLSCNGGAAPLCVAMDGSRSYDPDGDIVRYVWHCGDGTILAGARAQHVYDPAVIPARYRVVLEVFDADGLSHSSALTLEVY